MTHPIVPHILELAAPVAHNLGLEVVSAVFRTNQNPPVLRVDIRNLTQDTGMEDCTRMSRALEAYLDDEEKPNPVGMPDNYVLEVSSPGADRALSTDREYISFRGFLVWVTAPEIFEGHREWVGTLIGRDEEFIRLSQKGRTVQLPRSIVERVQLDDRKKNSDKD
jgi:ribosome maturation factor RimP